MIENKNGNMLKLVKYLAAIMLIAYSISAAIFFASGGRFFDDDRLKTTLNDTKKSDLQGIDKIIIDGSSENMRILPAESNEINAYLHGSITSTSKYAKPELQVSKSGNTLVIKVEHKTHVTFGFFSSDIHLDVNIPASYRNAVEITSTSGDIQIDGLKLSDLKLGLSSGNIRSEDLVADNFALECTSGDTNLDGLKTKTASFEVSSGNINVTDFTGNLKSDSTSGDSTFAYAAFNNNVNVETSSGNITLSMPSASQFNLDASATSGDVSCDFPLTITGSEKHNAMKGNVGSSSNQVNLHATSGNIRCLKR